MRQQLRDNLYKLWPTQPLSPGEYAVVQYVEGDGQIQVWDFRVPLNPDTDPNTSVHQHARADRESNRSRGNGAWRQHSRM